MIALGDFEIPKAIESFADDGPNKTIVTFVQNKMQELKQLLYFAHIDLDVQWCSYRDLQALCTALTEEEDEFEPYRNDAEATAWQEDHYIKESSLCFKFAREYYVFPSAEIAAEAYEIIFKSAKEEDSKKRRKPRDEQQREQIKTPIQTKKGNRKERVGPKKQKKKRKEQVKPKKPKKKGRKTK